MMKVRVDFDTCDGNAVCMSICHEVFELDDDGVLHVHQDRLTDELHTQLKGAEKSCPTQAIKVED
ncbi:ferredoxin [Mycobacterium sp. IDR2000157661]|uniref:ferredoxin n=1 Tax=Mycobacterium sp. IDR2000157661 TaxID=2867005 RepID=UPI00351D41B9